MSSAAPSAPRGSRAAATPLADRGPHESYRQHLVLDTVADAASADVRRRDEALARTIRDQIAPRWIETQRSRSPPPPRCGSPTSAFTT